MGKKTKIPKYASDESDNESLSAEDQLELAAVASRMPEFKRPIINNQVHPHPKVMTRSHT